MIVWSSQSTVLTHAKFCLISNLKVMEHDWGLLHYRAHYCERVKKELVLNFALHTLKLLKALKYILLYQMHKILWNAFVLWNEWLQRQFES